MRELAEERAEKDRLRELRSEAKDERLKKLREAVGAGGASRSSDHVSRQYSSAAQCTDSSRWTWTPTLTRTSTIARWPPCLTLASTPKRCASGVCLNRTRFEWPAQDVDAEGKPTWVDSDVEDEHLPYVVRRPLPPTGTSLMLAQNGEADDDAYDPSAPVAKESKKDRKKRKREAAAAAAEEANEVAADDEPAQKKAYDAYFDRFEYEDLVRSSFLAS